MSTGQRKDPNGPRSGEDPIGTGEVAELIPGSLASLENTLPPTPLKKLLAADGASVYVLSVDVSLIDTVHDAAGEQYPVHTVADWVDLVELVDSGRCKIALLDADLVGSGLERRVEELKNAGDGLVILVAAPRDAAQNLIGLLSDRSVHRLLIKPAAVGITRLLLESAVSRFLQLREIAREHEETHRLMSPRRRPPVEPATRMSPLMLSVALVSVLLGGLIAASFVRFWDQGVDDGGGQPSNPQRSAEGLPTARVAPDPVAGAPGATSEDATGGGPQAPLAGSSAEPGPTAEPASGRASSSAVADDVTPGAPGQAPPDGEADELAGTLEQARQAVEAGRLASPEGQSALDLFSAILQSDPGQPEASAGLAEVLDALYSRAEAAMLDGDTALAGSTLDRIRPYAEDSGRLAFLDAQLASIMASAADAESSAAAPAEANPAAAAGPTGELASLLTLARTRLDRGQLLTPAGDSARDYLVRALDIQADEPTVIRLRADLAEAVASSARVSLDAGDLDGASGLIDTAFGLGADSDTLVQLDFDLTSAREAQVARERASQLARGLDQLARGALVAPEGDSALDHLRALMQADPTLPGLAAGWSQLEQALEGNVRSRIEQGNWDEADSWIDSLAEMGDAEAPVDELRADVAAGRLQESYLQTPADVSELEIVQAGAVDYPQNANRRRIEGWVDVELVVGRDGRPRDIQIIGAEPEGWFEEAAVAAAGDTRWAPFELDGRVYERLARMRIRFGLQ